MNLLDLAILLPVIFFAVQGFRNGIVREVLTIIGILLAVWLAFRYMGELAEILHRWFDRPKDLLALISALVIFTLVLILAFTLSRLMSRLLVLIRLHTVNRFFGMIFGALKSGVIISVILLVLAGFGVPSQETREKSVAYPWMIRLAPAAYDMMASFYPGSESFMNRIRNTFDDENPLRNLPNVNTDS